MTAARSLRALLDDLDNDGDAFTQAQYDALTRELDLLQAKAAVCNAVLDPRCTGSEQLDYAPLHQAIADLRKLEGHR